VRPGDQQAAAASDFIKSVGINIHAGFGWTSYNNLQTVVDSLKYLGITHLRDTLVYDGNWLNKIDELGALGYDFSFFINNNEYSPLEWQLEQIAKRVHMTSVIEGPNETDLWPVTYGTLSGMEATRALMRDLYFKVNDESTLLGQSLKDVSVIQTSFAFPNSMVAAGDLSSFADYGNTHTYFSWGATPGSGIDSRIRDAQLVSRSDAMMTTEAGYHTAINSNQSDTNVGITEAVQAKYIARLLMEQYARGVERTYLYELLDQNADPALSNKELNFGLFQEDGTPKLAAHAVHNLMTTLKDDGQSFKPGYLGYHWKGMPGTADDLLFQKSDGRFILVVWNDVDIWDESARREIELTDAQVTLRFDKAAKSVKVYDALRSAEIPTATFYDKSSISLAIPEHPILIEILPSDFVL
jgi:hypothetical protein